MAIRRHHLGTAAAVACAVLALITAAFPGMRYRPGDEGADAPPAGTGGTVTTKPVPVDAPPSPDADVIEPDPKELESPVYDK